MALARALVLEAPRQLRARELPLPVIGDDDGLLRIEACGLCGTDHEQFTGALPGPGAFIPGHEIVGIVEEIGSRAAARWGVAAGDRVAVEVFQSCGDCEPCRSGTYRRCRRHGMRDMYGFVNIDSAPGLWGGYATHLYVAPDALLLPVPSNVDPVLASLFNPLGAGIRWGVTIPGTRKGDVVAVLGPGIRGLSVLVAVKRAGAGSVMVTGSGERDDARLAVAAAFGADATVNVARDDPVAALRSTAGQLADVVVDVTAKAPAALGQAVALAKPGGTVVIAGTRGSRETPGFAPDDIVYKELRMLGAMGVDAPAYREALDLLASGEFPFRDIPREIVGLETVDSMLRRMAGEADPAPPLHGVVVP